MEILRMRPTLRSDMSSSSIASFKPNDNLDRECNGEYGS